MRRDTITHTITFNRSRKTYTIRCYANGKQYAKYRTVNMGKQYKEDWTEYDIRNFLRTSLDYFKV